MVFFKIKKESDHDGQILQKQTRGRFLRLHPQKNYMRTVPLFPYIQSLNNPSLIPKLYI